MKTKIPFIALLLFSKTLDAQAPVCNCDEALKKLIIKIEYEYPGFKDKIKDSVYYSTYKKSVTEEAKNAGDSACIKVLEKYVDYFKDEHIWIIPKTVKNDTPQREVQSIQKLNIDLNAFKKEIAKTRNELEGIWKNKSYEIGVKKIRNGDYAGFIIHADPKYWKQNEIKFRLFKDGKFEYYMQDRSIQKGTYKIIGKSALYFKELKITLMRRFPASILNEAQVTDSINLINGFYLKPVTPKTALLRLPDFNWQSVEAINEMIERNKYLLENSAYLILDLRGNGGGTGNAYRKILPYLLSSPLRRNIGVEHLSTPTTINAYETWLTTLRQDSIKNYTQIKNVQNSVDLLKAHPGQLVNLGSIKSGVLIDSIQLAAKSPKEIVILVDKNVGSSAEDLVLQAKQSKKVKIMGIPTAGGLDYADARFFELGCTNYQLLLPTYRSLRLPDYPIDSIGIQPDIYLDKSITDWVQFAVDYLEKN